MASLVETQRAKPHPAVPGEFRRLLPQEGRPIETLEAYRAQGGLKGLERARDMSPLDVIAEVKKSGLRGRGGAGFPAGVKWETLYQDTSPIKYVCCNGAEGEPGTFKDRYLLLYNPYLVLEGIAIAAHAIGAKQTYLGIKSRFVPQVERLTKAITELEAAGVVEPGFIELALGPDEYLFGEEKALLEVVEGREAMPRNLPPFLFGLFCQPGEYNPALVNNLETLSHVAQIFQHDADWFRSVGSKDTPGTMIMTLCGDVQRPGMYEIPLGMTVNQFLHDLGGGPPSGHPFQAIFSGVANPVLTADKFDAPIEFGALRAAGGGLGSGGLIVYDASACILRVAQMFARFLHYESCGQCVPCKTGTGGINTRLEALELGRSTPTDIQVILNTCTQAYHGTRCFLPQEAAMVVRSVIEKYPDEVESHLQRGCSNRRRLMLPKIVDFDEDAHTFQYDTKY